MFFDENYLIQVFSQLVFNSLIYNNLRLVPKLNINIFQLVYCKYLIVSCL